MKSKLFHFLRFHRPLQRVSTARVEVGAETVGAIGEMVKAGYVRHISLSEVGADTLRRAGLTVEDVHIADIRSPVVSNGCP